MERAPDRTDGRRKRPSGHQAWFCCTACGEAIFENLRSRWARQIGAAELKTLEKHLSKLIGPGRVRLDDMPG